MKTYYSIALMMLLSVASCNKNEKAMLLPQQEQGLRLRVTACGNSVTKASEAENAVSSLEVYAFKSTGNSPVFETCAREESAALELSMTGGAKLFHAFANVPYSLGAVKGTQSLQEKKTYLRDNAPGRLLMKGSVSESVSAFNAEVEIPVERLCARIRLAEIQNRLANGYAQKGVSVSRIFLGGAQSSALMNGEDDGDGLYALDSFGSLLERGGDAVGSDEKAAVNALIYKEIHSGAIPQDGVLDLGTCLYTYPNDGSLRETRLIVEMLIDGLYYTYPVEIPVRKSNTSYEVSRLVLLSLGNPSNGDDVLDPGEDEPISRLDAGFSIEIKDWDIRVISNGDDGNYTI